MSYLLDTNVISETIKKNPDTRVLRWLSSIDSSQFSLSVLTVGEIRKGIERLADGSKKQSIIQWLEVDLMKQFYGRVILIDERVTDKWGYIGSIVTIPAIDALIAASAMVHNLKIVTRHIKDFEKIVGLEIINPWANEN